jgi:hypothetical protein
MKLERIYIVLTDIWHLLLGLLTPYTAQILEALLGIRVPAIATATAMAVIYVSYQSLDDDPPEERTADLLEYILGIITAIAHRTQPNQ